VAEKGRFPNIYIYEYPSLKLYRIMKNGTENLYSHVEFSVSGTKLASVGGNPDFTITVWDWMSQKVILKAKAFSQEVFKVTFSPFTDDILFTCGSGHIRFWKMAQTFTGLKLQGEIGKFGQLELSDVTGIAELPDGKVLCGSEYGTLILWDGNLVKAHLVLDEYKKTPLHNGFVEVVMFDGEHFITAGGDGYIKWWRFVDVDNAEADEHLEVAIAPVREVLVKDPAEGGEPAYIVSMIKGNDHWLIADGKGKIWRLPTDTMEAQLITSFHSKKVTDLAVPPSINGILTLGEDGHVKLWDFVKEKQFYTRRFIGEGTCCDMMPYSEANQGRILATGFDNGIVRVLLIGSHDFMILKAFKAHDSKVIKVKYSPDNTMLATASEDGDIFFFQIGTDNLQRYDPLCLVQIPSAEPTFINELRWDSNSTKILVGC
jgi:cilia- and flagella-associated protein 44